MRFRTLLILPFIFAVSVAFASDVHFHEGDKQPVRLHRGQRLIIELDAASDGGYGWQAATRPRLRHLRFVTRESGPKDETPRKEGEPPMVGQPGKNRFIYKAVSRGTATIKLIYGRPWMIRKGQKPEKTLTIRAKIR